MWYILIAFHSLAGLISFGTGLMILSPKRAKKHPRIVMIYILSLVGLIVFMIGAMLSHWQEISSLEQNIFSGLVLLGMYMLYRALDAKRLLLQGEKNYPRYIEGIGFTLISLFDGFVIVGAIDLKFPVWLVIAIAIGAVLVGNRLLNKAKNNYLH